MHCAEAIAGLSGIDSDAVQGVERIKHGLTNESWLVSSVGEKRVVRISNTEDDSLQINRASEAIVLGLVGRAGIGPEVIVCDPERRLLVTRYMGETWSDAQTQHPENIDRVAALLCRLHAVAAPAEVQRVNLLAVIDGYLRTLDTHAVVCEMSTPTLRTYARETASALYQDSIECLCHNDVHALNIVGGDGPLRLIDWEYAGVGEPFFDLAAISIYHRYDKLQRERLLAAYGTAHGQSGPASWRRLELVCWLFDYIRDLWTAVRELGAPHSPGGPAGWSPTRGSMDASA